MKTLLFIAWIGSYSGDAITTTKIHFMGGHEQNPLMSQNTLINNSVLGAEAVSGLALVNRFYAKHPKLTKAFMIMNIATEGYCTIHNAINIHNKT